MDKKSLVARIMSNAVWLVGVLLFVASVYFWMFRYPAHLAFGEQIQLFLLTFDYFLPFLSYPSGIANYVGEFLTQFNYEIWWGAVIVSALIALVYVQSCVIISRETRRYGLIRVLAALVPAFFVWLFMLDRFSLLAMPVALSVALSFIQFYQIWLRSIGNRVLRHVVLLLIAVGLYWSFGAVTFVFGVFVALNEIVRLRDYAASLHIVAIVLMPLLAYTFVPFPLQRLYTSNCYYKMMDERPSLSYDAEDEEALLYSFLSHYKKWDAAIRKAEKKMPDDLASRQIVMHALAEKNLLLDRLFEYPIIQRKDLISSQSGDMREPMSVSDLYFSLGMINTAELSAYNMQQLYFGQGVRAFQRLAECNIVKGDYRIARKYLNALKQTLFYKKWAEEMEKLIDNANGVEMHPYYGVVRNRLMKETFYFSDKELDNILAHSVNSSMDAHCYDYLVAYLILSNDLDKLAKLMEGNTNRMPKAVQEALVFHWMSKNPSFDGMPWNIDMQVMRGAVDFMRMMNEGGNMQTMRPAFGKTYWYYNAFASRKTK